MLNPDLPWTRLGIYKSYKGGKASTMSIPAEYIKLTGVPIGASYEIFCNERGDMLLKAVLK
jgi:hypothetical protein